MAAFAYRAVDRGATKNMNICAALVLLVTLPAAIGAQTPITARNWKTHPDIVAVRSIFDSTEALIARKRLTESRVHIPYCDEEHEGGDDRVLYVDPNGRALKFSNGRGTGDHDLSMDWYYDTRGALRFVFVQGGATNGTEIENRIYFDAKGRRLWQDYRVLKGHHTDLGRDVSDSDLVRDPKKEFARQVPPCDTAFSHRSG
jgi:hypothetical protein